MTVERANAHRRTLTIKFIPKEYSQLVSVHIPTVEGGTPTYSAVVVAEPDPKKAEQLVRESAAHNEGALAESRPKFRGNGIGRRNLGIARSLASNSGFATHPGFPTASVIAPAAARHRPSRRRRFASALVAKLRARLGCRIGCHSG
jgi:hypothetical protein